MLVILISGFTKPDFLWSYLFKSLAADKTIIFKYKFWEDLDISVRSLNDLIKDQRKRYPDIDEVVVIGHSMGGLIARRSLADLVVTIASPNDGTILADISPGLSNIVPSINQMKKKSSFIRKILAEKELPQLINDTPSWEKKINPLPRLLCLAAEHEYLVLPRSSAFVPWAQNKTIKGVGHVGILTNIDTLEAIEDFLHLHHR